MKIQQASHETFRTAQAGDLQARNEIILKNYGLVVKAAMHATQGLRFNREVMIDDRIQDGMVHMSHIISRFDPGSGVKFSSFAMRCLNRLMAEKQVEDTVIKVPASKGPVSQDTQALKEQMRRTRPLCDRQIAARQHVEPSDANLGDVLRETDKLDEGQRNIVHLRLEGLTCEEIGRRIGCSKQSVSMILKGAVLELQTNLMAA